MATRNQVKKMKKAELIKLAAKEDLSIEEGMNVTQIRGLINDHFSTTTTSPKPKTTTSPKPKTSNVPKVTVKAFAKLTDKQLLKVTDKLGWTDSIKGGTKGWQLRALTVCHAIPSTHAEAVEVAKRLTALLNKGLVHSKTPRLHYGKANGGIDSRFTQDSAYYPGKFGARSRLGESYTLKCSSHSSQYSKCSADCQVGVKVDDKWLYESVKSSSTSTSTPRRRRSTTVKGKNMAETIEGQVEQAEAKATT